MRELILIIFSFFIITFSYGQKKYLSVKVSDSISGQIIIDAKIIVFNSDGQNIVLIAGKDSIFRIDRELIKRLYNFEVNAASYVKAIIRIHKDFSVRDTDLFLVKLTPKIIQLEEVVIRKRRYRDTTNINLSGQTFEKNQMIDDLFSSGIGFTKDSNGAIYFKGDIEPLKRSIPQKNLWKTLW